MVSNWPFLQAFRVKIGQNGRKWVSKWVNSTLGEICELEGAGSNEHRVKMTIFCWKTGENRFQNWSFATWVNWSNWRKWNWRHSASRWTIPPWNVGVDDLIAPIEWAARVERWMNFPSIGIIALRWFIQKETKLRSWMERSRWRMD